MSLRLLTLLARSGGSGAAAWSVPSMFTDGSFPVNLVISGDTYSTDYDAADFENTGTDYYVTTAGNDTTGDGSVGTPWRTIQKAIDTAATGSRINVGAGRFPNFTCANKNYSIFGVSNSTYVGDLLAESDITWGALSSGRQTATLASSTVSGFVDLTLTKRTANGVGVPEVSMVAASAAAIATLQAAGDPGVFRSTPSTVGASDSRNLSGSADTDIMVWKATAAAPFVLTGTTQLYAKDITFVGGASASVASTSRLVDEDCRFLGAVGQNFTSSGTSVGVNRVARGIALTNFDVLDYATTATMVEVNNFADQGGAGAADNISTLHGGIGMRVNGTYLDATRTIHDNSTTIIGMFGSTVGAATGGSSLVAGGSGSLTDGHYAAITWNAGATNDISGVTTPPNSTRMFFYDTSYSGKSQQAGTNLIDRSGARPTSDETFLRFDPSDLSTLFQDTAGTIPVTTAGDTVARINDTTDPTNYATVTAGALTYQTDGTLHWLASALTSTRLLLSCPNATFEESSNAIIGINATSTTGILCAQSSSTFFGDYRVGTTSPTTNNDKAGKNAGNPTYYVDAAGSPVTTKNALSAAAFNSAPHVLSIRGVNMGWCGWQACSLLNAASGSSGLVGKFYGYEISRPTTAAALLAREQAMAAKCGITIP